MKFTLVATCLFGLEKLLGDEIEALGYERKETIDGRVSYFGDEEAVAISNIFLRCAERVYIEVGAFNADTFDRLFEGAKALPWEDFITPDGAFPVKGHSIKSKLFSLPDCQSIIKKAVATRLGACRRTSLLPETGAKHQIEFFIFKDIAHLMLDTSGTPLHKRGYRPETTAAPLRETLAAAIAMISRPRENVLLWDPFCGSGTIAIEAAMIMSGRSPGENRRFAAEEYPYIGEKFWKNAREEALSAHKKTDFEVFASDIDQGCIRITRDNIKRAGVEGIVKAFVKDARDLRPMDRRGTIATNPPFGERLMTEEQVRLLYSQIGRTFSALAPWQIYILSAFEDFARYYGKRPDKTRKLYNGMIPCWLYQYFKNDQ